MRRLRLAACVLIVCAHWSLFGQNSNSNGDEKPAKPPKSGETIVVTATRSERAVSDVPVSTTVVPPEAVKSAPTLQLDDLLRTVPGIHMPLTSSNVAFIETNRISMRGLGGMRALVLLDGVPMHDPYYGTVQWFKAPLTEIRQIEVVRGGSASLFGNFALGGAIHVLSNPVESGGVSLDTAAGSFDTERLNAIVDQQVTDSLGLRLSHYRFDSNGFLRVLPADRGVIDKPTWGTTESTSLRADYALSEGTHMTTKISTGDGGTSQGTDLSWLRRNNFDTSVLLQHAVGASGLLSASAFHEREKLHIDSTTPARDRSSEFLSADSSIPVEATGGSVEWSRSLAGPISFVSAGIDTQQTLATETRNALSSSGVLTQQNIVRGRQTSAGIFGQASWRPSTRIEVLGSARFDYSRNAHGSDTPLVGTRTDYPQRTSREWNPRVSARYALTDRVAIRASAYRAFRAPTLKELYRTAQLGRLLLLSNPYLEPEIMRGADVGVEWVAGRSHAQVNLYRSDVENVVVRLLVSPDNPNIQRPENVGKSRSQGIEAMYDYRLSDRWSLNAGYTLANSVMVDNPPDRSLQGKEIPEVVPRIASLGMRFNARSGAAFDVRARHDSKSYDDAANTAVMPAHTVVDMSISTPIARSLEVYVIGENIFNAAYLTTQAGIISRPAQPRTITGGLRLHAPIGRLF